ITLLDPKGRAAAEERGLTSYFALQPIGVIFGQGVLGFGCIGRNAFGSCYIDEGIVSRSVGFLRDGMNCLQFGRRIQKALVSAFDIVIYLDAEDTAGLSAGHDLRRVIRLKPVCADANVVCPILFAWIG